MSGWSELSACSAPCGAGNKTKTRTVTTQPENGGAACPALEESEGCNGNGSDCPDITPVLMELKSQSSKLKSDWASLTSDAKDEDILGLNLTGVTILDDMMTKLTVSEVSFEGAS
jgi:hypothetical protein